jgi:acetylornithine/succinyldiaminopimelate/putrescine aminotransferase
VEPIQGRGGDRPPPKGWLRALRHLCDQHGMLLIFDEVFTGFGRAGALFQVRVRRALTYVGTALKIAPTWFLNSNG